MQRQRYLPRLSIRGLLLIMTGSTILAVIGSLAAGGNQWAQMFLVSLLWLIVAFAFFATAFLVASVFALLLPPQVAEEAAPFEDQQQLPPQWIVPEDPE